MKPRRRQNEGMMRNKIFVTVIVVLLTFTGCGGDGKKVQEQIFKEGQEMEKAQYQFRLETDQEKVNEVLFGTSKICNIIDGFPRDYMEQTVLVYGRLKGLFGEPAYETLNYEDQYSYYIFATAEDGKEIFLNIYSGPSGPAIGGQQDKESAAAADQLVQIILQTEPVDYDYVGYYLDGPVKIHQGVKNGVSFMEEEELDPEDEEFKELVRQVTGLDV